MNKNDKKNEAIRLRSSAEQMAKWTLVHPMQGESDAQKLLHELQVHHIELEMQNAELRRSQHEIEIALKKVADLNENLKQSIIEKEAIQNIDESVKHALLASINNEILEPISVIKKLCNQLRYSDIDSKLAEQLDLLEMASLKLLKSINSF